MSTPNAPHAGSPRAAWTWSASAIQNVQNPSPPRKPVAHRIVLNLGGLRFVAALLGAIVGFVRAFGAVSSETLDPGEKASILADGISLSVNCSKFAVVVAMVGGPIVLG